MPVEPPTVVPMVIARLVDVSVPLELAARVVASLWFHALPISTRVDTATECFMKLPLVGVS